MSLNKDLEDAIEDNLKLLAVNMFLDKEKSVYITENQRLRNELINIRRIKYVIPNSGAESLLSMAIKIAGDALNFNNACGDK